jgi:hypothetical protein
LNAVTASGRQWFREARLQDRPALSQFGRRHGNHFPRRIVPQERS